MVAYERGLFRRDSNYSYSLGEILVGFFFGRLCEVVANERTRPT